MESIGPRQSAADELLDELLPEELDWQGLVRRYPKSALVVAAAGGYWLGHGRGREIVTALVEFASDAVTDTVNELLGSKVL